MYQVTKYPHGTFSWADCATTDWANGKKFYTEVMGWGYEDLPIGEGRFYTMFKQDGHNVAAISEPPPEMRASDFRAMWNNYITVDDVDSLVDKVKSSGGTILAEPFDVFEDGRMMRIQEPTGAVVSLWQAKNNIGASLVNTVGAMLWNEFLTAEPQKMMDFFCELLAWEFQQDGERDYYMIINQGRMNGGIFALTGDMAHLPSSCMVYYNIADLDATLEKVKSNGGAINMEGEAEGIGRFAIISDPQGASLYVMQADENIQAWEEK